MGCAVGDVDNDGDTDLFCDMRRSAIGFFRNEGGTFTEATAEVGLAGDDIWSTSAGFFDYDRDGHLDLFVCNYVAWSPEIDAELNFSLNGTDRAYGPPDQLHRLVLLPLSQPGRRHLRGSGSNLPASRSRTRPRGNQSANHWP